MREKIVAGNVYHVLNRGVDKRKIFMDDRDYFRFVHNLFEFNDLEPPNNNTYYFNRQKQSMDIARPYIAGERKPRKLLVEILAFCLMPNHYHLLIKPKSDDGITKFIKKLNMGYAKYFNERYKRSGALFQGRYKLIPVTEESHFIHLPYYIHLNPLDLVMPEWRNYGRNNYGLAKTIDWKGAGKFLEKYRWSSYLDYIGKRNFPSVTQREFLTEFFGGPEQYKKDTIKWLKEMDLEEIKNITLE
ncbi:MAG: hypothetical protein UY26_C0003G0303 [Candidatus Jorgensenbacteria bacterium GW2011_GWA1_48_13]|uniref:Transposase IS200-like domain-containing protein n=2 Tax=Candidatus Joergenseniibacteriota TaxID=1752739 RepID=A0A0G1Z798_9BACT|nr:MAG: hypothetical protein UY26_C0003G0303 [Candidatus Jorgensenbacteria bacterium GW2011_GWA1_48_13]KKU99238.1 MAG: hypothetical protein UY32_C0003G0008 [Candidatus Jorgensenbacteria bacterium GW2011_GWC1_48_8]KKW14809.1 MAG: hypothetical protein UY55_C0003G0025 [Candidatus Jorgensenbacteria bacterium GW2011_GWB1_50_10]